MKNSKKKIMIAMLGVIVAGYIISEDLRALSVKTGSLSTKTSKKIRKTLARQVEEKKQEQIFDKLPSLADLEAQYKHVSIEHLKFYIGEAERNLNESGYIERANANSLSAEERKTLAFKIRRLTVLRKLIVERQLDEIERERS